MNGFVLVLGLIGWHDIPNERVDRAIQVELVPGTLRVDYEVSLSELTLTTDLKSLIGSLPGEDREGWFRRYGTETGPLNARGFLASVDGREFELTYRSFDLFVEEHPRYVFHLEGSLPESGQLALRDLNYVSSEGTSRLAVRAADGVTLGDAGWPTDVQSLPEVPVVLLDDEQERRTKELRIGFATVGQSREIEVAAPPPVAVVPEGPRRLTALLDRRESWWIGALLALGLGAAHALQPGHGKSVIAAAALGSRRRGVALTLAVAAAVAHLAVVLALAGVLLLTRGGRYADLDAAVVRGAGVLLALIGAWRLGRVLASRKEAVVAGPPPTTQRGAIALGLAAGAIPCWEAVLLIVLADALGRPWLGLALLAGFSAGLALVLLLVALASGRMRIEQGGRTLDLIAALALLAIGGVWALR